MDQPLSATSAVSAGTGLRHRVGLRLRTSEILAFLLLVQVGWLTWTYATNSLTIDFFTVWSAPHAFSLRPQTNIYSPEGQRDIASVVVAEANSQNASDLQKKTTVLSVNILYNGRIDAIASPFLYTAVGWLSSGAYLTDQKRFVLVSILCLFLSMMVLKNLLRFSAVEIFLLTMFIAIEFEPVLSDLRLGNVNEIQLFGIVLFILLSTRAQPLLAGLALGATTMLKPTTTMVFVLAMIAPLADRDFRQLFRVLSGFVIAVGAALAASMAFFRNPAIWFDFWRSLHKTLSGVPYPIQEGNFSLAALLGTTNRLSTIIILALLIAFSWFFFATAQKGTSTAGTKKAPTATSNEIDTTRRMHTGFAVAGGGWAITLLSSPYVWLHYYVALLPLLLFLMRPDGFQGAAASYPDPAQVEAAPTPALLAGPDAGRATSSSAIALSLLPFVLLLIFSVPTKMIIGDNPRLLCVLFILAMISTLSLALYRIRQQRLATRLEPV